ncbi:MAG: sigma-70 family RNA polymerase sigma factor [Gammaproteobacteria bacterium]|nr:sigma-70 family RNA polymerase sigma factor [Gammaproteobacteria bacterium]
MLGLLDSDEHLIRRALEGSARAWTKLVQRYERKVYNHALRLAGNPEDALDLMQDAFLAAYRNLPNFRGEGAFPAWLMRIAGNRALDFLRRRQLTRQHFAEDAEEAMEQVAGGTTPFEQLADAQKRGHVLELLQRLPAEQRLVLELKFFQDLTFEEIAAQMRIPVNTAKTRMYAGLSRLRGHVEMSHAL